MSLTERPPDQPIPPGEFPNGSAVKGKVYGVVSPVVPLERLIVMNEETWLDFGTLLESLRNVARNQDRELKKRADELADVSRRLENLRAVRRAEKRAEIEPMVQAAIDESNPN